MGIESQVPLCTLVINPSRHTQSWRVLGYTHGIGWTEPGEALTLPSLPRKESFTWHGTSTHCCLWGYTTQSGRRGRSMFWTKYCSHWRAEAIRRPNTSDTKANWRLRLYWKMGKSPPTPTSATEWHCCRHSQFQGVMQTEDTKFLRTALWETNPHSENEVWPQGFKPSGTVYTQICHMKGLAGGNVSPFLGTKTVTLRYSLYKTLPCVTENVFLVCICWGT